MRGPYSSWNCESCIESHYAWVLMRPLIVACYQPKWSGSGEVFRLDLGKTVEGCFRIPAQEKRHPAMTYLDVILLSFLWFRRTCGPSDARRVPRPEEIPRNSDGQMSKCVVRKWLFQSVSWFSQCWTHTATFRVLGRQSGSKRARSHQRQWNRNTLWSDGLSMSM